MKEKSHKELQPDEERIEIMKNCSFGLNGVHFTDEDLKNHVVPEKYRDVPIRFLYPEIEIHIKEDCKISTDQPLTKGE